MTFLFLLVIILLAICIHLQINCSYETTIEPFEPDPNTKMKRANELATDPKIIKSGYAQTKSKFDWIDPIIYEHARRLLHSEQFTTDNILRSM